MGLMNERIYGIKPLTVEEELNYPANAKQTRNNKMKIVDMCERIRSLIYVIECRAKGAPELDDAKHAALVQELADKVRDAHSLLKSTWQIGR